MDNNSTTNEENNNNENNTDNTSLTTNIDQTNTDNQQSNSSDNNTPIQNFNFDFISLSIFFLSKEILTLISLKLTSPEDKEKQSNLLDKLLKDLLKLIKLTRHRTELLCNHHSDYVQLATRNTHFKKFISFFKELSENNLQNELFIDHKNTMDSVYRLFNDLNTLRQSSNQTS